MLSGESAGGKYPFKAVQAMMRVLRKNEHVAPDFEHMFRHMHTPADCIDINFPRREQALAASILATKLNADAIVAITRTGTTARAVSNCRPMIPIHAFAATEETTRKLMLSWGVTPHTIDFSEDREKTLLSALAHAKKNGYLKKGQRIVAVSDIRTGKASVMTIQIRTID
jgi:pyruvate kinase